MKIGKYIKADFNRIAFPSIKNMVKYYLFPQGTMFRFIVWLRIMQKVKSNKCLKTILGFPVYLIFRHYEFKYGIHVNSNMQIGPGLCIEHGDGVYLNCKQIGKNFTCFQGVTLGTAPGGERMIPVVKDNVTVYAGAVVSGDIILNDKCVVGANSFVNKDVEENTVVVGNPAKKKEKVEK